MKKIITRLPIALAMLLLAACSKKADTSPAVTTISASDLLGARWTTTAATAVKKSDGSTVTFTGVNLTQLYLSDVAFQTVPNGTTPGTANESDYGALTWTLAASGTTSTLSVFFSTADGSAIGTITKLDAHTLVLHRAGSNPDVGGIYAVIDQTLTR